MNGHFLPALQILDILSVIFLMFQMLVASKQQGHTRSEFITEQLTTTQGELGLKVGYRCRDRGIFSLYTSFFTCCIRARETPSTLCSTMDQTSWHM